jgi:DNA polymerase-3 subunit gamma/tau
MSYQALARRWRPVTFDAVVGQGPIVRTLQNALARGRIAQAYLFAGPRGVGKTTTARLLAMGLNCARPAPEGPVPCAACEPCREIVGGRALDVIEIDGASNRGIDEVRALRENARYAPAHGRRKVYIIDEVHMLTEPAFNALLKTLEEPPAHVVFVLATTEARRLPATILSRCQRFDFRPIGAGEIAAALGRILAAEGPGVSAEPDALVLVARASDGSLRDALSLLDTTLAYAEGRVTAEAVKALLGSGGAEAAWGLAEALVGRAPGPALDLIARAAADGLDLGLLAQEALEILRQALLVRVAPGPGTDRTAEESERLGALGAAGGGVDELVLLVKGLLEAEAEMRRSPHPRVDLEIAVVRLCQRPRPEALEAVLERLEQAEARLRGYGGGIAGTPAATPPAQAELLPAPGSTSSAGPPRSASRSPERAAPASARPGPGPRAGSPGEVAMPPPRAPGSAEPATPGSGGPADSGAEATWRQIVAEVTRLRPTLGHLLDDARVVSDEGGRLTVAVPNGGAFVQDRLREPATRELLVEVARRTRADLRDVSVTAGLPPGGAPAGVAEHPVVQATMELFNGEVAAVRPAAPRDDRGGSAVEDAPPDREEA